MEVDYHLYTPAFTDSFVSEFLGLAEQIFGNIDRDDLSWRLNRLADVSLHVAQYKGRLVAFKFGHALSSRRYLSWLGGVSPDFQRRGIARELMSRQHEWIAQQGYAGVETSAVKDNVAMLMLNLQSGFEIIGFYSRDNTPRVMLRKRFDS